MSDCTSAAVCLSTSAAAGQLLYASLCTRHLTYCLCAAGNARATKVLQLLYAAVQPLMQMLSIWLGQGQLVDPNGEFFVEASGALRLSCFVIYSSAGQSVVLVKEGGSSSAKLAQPFSTDSHRAPSFCHSCTNLCISFIQDCSCCNKLTALHVLVADSSISPASPSFWTQAYSLRTTQSSGRAADAAKRAHASSSGSRQQVPCAAWLQPHAAALLDAGKAQVRGCCSVSPPWLIC